MFGDGATFCAAFINIDLTAVGNWAERNNIAYASYQELAGASARSWPDRRRRTSRR